MSISKHFRIEELVPKELFDLVKEDTLWEMLDDKLLETLDYLKEKFPEGTMTINNWLWGGKYSQSGLRTKNAKEYSSTSQHSLGKAADLKFSDYNNDSVRQYIINNPEEFPYIKGIEMGVDWVHIDVRSRDEVLLFDK